MLVKELQLLKSGERVRGGGGEGLFDEELPRRPSRQSRRHSRLDEEGEEEVETQLDTFIDHQQEGGESEGSTEGEEEKGGRVSTISIIIVAAISITIHPPAPR